MIQPRGSIFFAHAGEEVTLDVGSRSVAAYSAWYEEGTAAMFVVVLDDGLLGQSSGCATVHERNTQPIQCLARTT